MVASILSGVTIFALTCGKINITVCVTVSILFAGLVLFWRKTHRHKENISIDYQAQKSKLSVVNASVKMIFAIAMLAVVVASSSVTVAIFVLSAMSIITVAIGKTKLNYYASALLVPGIFIMLSAITLAVEISPRPLGYVDYEIFGAYLCITRQSQDYAILVILKALSAVSCLYMLNLSTPMSEMIATLKNARIPSVLIELIYLVYRYIFIVTDMLASMKTASKSRLGGASYRARFSSFINIGSALLIRSLMRARKSFDAMESRGYDGKLEFFTETKRVGGVQTAVFGGVFAVSLGIMFFSQRGV